MAVDFGKLYIHLKISEVKSTNLEIMYVFSKLVEEGNTMRKATQSKNQTNKEEKKHRKEKTSKKHKMR